MRRPPLRHRPSRFAAAWAGAAAWGLCCALWAGGCALRDAAEEAWFQTTRTLKVDGGDYVDGAETVLDDWGEVRELGRPGQAGNSDDEDWYRKYIMSEKSRDIERNLGLE